MAHYINYLLRLVAMRRMPTILQLDNFALFYGERYPVNLSKSTILIVNAVQRQQRTATRCSRAETPVKDFQD
jgi:hypothetical protein